MAKMNGKTGCPEPGSDPFVRALRRKPTDPLRLGAKLLYEAAGLKLGAGRALTRAERKCVSEIFDVMIEHFRNQPGANVRLPSHHLPPIRSRPLEVFGSQDINGDTAGTRRILASFTCPRRNAGVVNGFAVSFNPSAAAATWFGDTTGRMELRVNGSIVIPTTSGIGGLGPVAGFNSARALMSRRAGVATAPAAGLDSADSAQGGVGNLSLVPCNVPFFPGDVVDVSVVTGTDPGASLILVARLSGYFYELRATTADRSILGTIVD